MRSTAPNAGTKAIPTFQLDGARIASAGRAILGPRDGRSKTDGTTDRSYHISNQADADGIVQTVAAIGAFAREHGPGCYSVDVRFRHLFPGCIDSSRAWGKVIHHPDGKIAIRIHPIVDTK